ncbi:MAG TPA: major capsid protein [Allocoleopsis sp.]
MSGALINLAAIGPQDGFLTGNPEATLFKKPYKRVTPHARQHVAVNFSGTPDFGKEVTATIPRNGDLVHRMYVQINLPALTGSGTQAWVPNIGNVMIDYVEVEIGANRVDKHYGQWLHIWGELTESASKENTYNVMIGNTSALNTEAASIAATTLYVPLRFWFNREIGLALPLIALQYNEVKIKVKFRPFSEVHVSSSGTVTTPSLTDAKILAEYIYLDVDERRKFAQTAHEYLIDQLQFTGAESFSQTSINPRLNFNHPCKALYWVAQLDSNVQTVAAAGGNANRWTDFTDNGTGPNPYEGDDPLVSGKIQLNGNDRFDVSEARYFNLVQPYQHHTRGPATGIYMYSFADEPEEHQPTGTLNMSRIDVVNLSLTLSSSAATKLYVYATNYNVFRIMSGMGVIHYSS